MIKLRFNTIRKRLTFWLLVSTLIPLIVVLGITYHQRVKYIRNSNFVKLAAIRDLKVDRLNDWLSERNNDLSLLANEHAFLGISQVLSQENLHDKSSSVKIQDVREKLLTTKQNSSIYNSICILNKNGRVVVSTNKENEGRYYTDKVFLPEFTVAKYISIVDIYFSKSMQETTMAYVVPIYGSSVKTNSNLVGVLIARVNLQNSLFKILNNRVGLGVTGETLIVNKKGMALNELRWHNNASLNLRITAEPAKRAANGETGIIISPDYRYKNVLAAYTYIEETGWGFVCKQDMHELNAPIRAMIWNFIFVFIITAVIILTLTINLSKSISKPILSISRVAQEFQLGNYAKRSTVVATDEISLLAKTFNSMAEVVEAKIIVQESISEVLETLRRQTTIKNFSKNVLHILMKITNANMCVFYVLDEVGSKYEHFASIGANKKLFESFSALFPEGELGYALVDKKIKIIKSIDKDTIFKFNTTVGQVIPKEIVTIPILVENTVVAIISIACINVIHENGIEVLKQTWSGINSTYASLLSSERTFILADNLARNNQQLELQSKELTEQTKVLHRQAEELRQKSDALHKQNVILEQQRIKVEEANRLKTDFLSNMSHELRTPLNSINALSQVLLKQVVKKLNSEEAEYLDIISRNGNHLLTLINDILDLSKIEAGKMELNIQPVSIRAQLLMVIDSIKILADEKNIKLTVDVKDDIPLINTDAPKLYHILTNIVGNAIKFTNKGMVKVSAWYKNQHIYISVEDTGIGIEEKMLPHIFDEFRQVDGSSSRQYQGTGLGLSIANKMAKLIGGEICVISELGKGSIFTIVLPEN